MYVIGTAGHVDHGKSTLVEALTGINPDRLREEQRRGMTIELGFAWMQLPSGRDISLVDVPGHERFIKQMLAGVSGFDAAVLVIAADESMMPQTREHLAIIELLEIPRGIVVVTKADMVEPAWLPLVVDDIRLQLAESRLADAPLVVVSAKTGYGMDELRRALDTLVSTLAAPTKLDEPARLWVDRVFSMDGFGAVVTGTLQAGALQVGDEVEVLPRGLRARIRGLQMHRQKLQQAQPGARVAINLAGVSHHDIARGDLITVPGTILPTDRIDVRLSLASVAPRPLAQGMQVDVFVGAAETPARVTLLDCDAIGPGEHAYAQLHLAHALPLWRGDRVVLRQPSPSMTLAGGRVIDTHPLRHRRHRRDVIERLHALERASPADLCWAALQGTAMRIEQLVQATHLDVARVQQTVAVLPAVRHVGGEWLMDAVYADGLLVQAEKALDGYKTRYPLRIGMPREDVRRRLGIEPGLFEALIVSAWHEVLERCGDGLLRRVGATVTLSPAQQQQVTAALATLRAHPYAPPPTALERELQQYLIGSGEIIEIADDVAFLATTWHELTAWVLTTIDETGSVTVGQFRDRFGTTRKYALAVLEYLDDKKITRRRDDARVRF
ncbi:MAG: selenocysteine-specific translation elongation factor [Chloroflexota bacterium]|jgi:selenocysteine-specific elongation factor